MSQAIATTNHDEIRRWAEARKGHAAIVQGTESKGGGGVLRIDFDPPDDSLERISWDEFFEIFDERGLAFLYQEKTAAGRKSRFGKFVSRDSTDSKQGQKQRARDEDEEEDEDADEELEEEEEEDEDEEEEEDEDDEDEDDRGR